MNSLKTAGRALAAAAAFTALAQPGSSEQLLDSIEGAQELSTWAWQPAQYGSAVAVLAHMELSYLTHIDKKWAYIGPGVAKQVVTPSTDIGIIDKGSGSPVSGTYIIDKGSGSPFTFPGVSFSSQALATDAHTLSGQFAGQLADERALNATIARYYGALEAGDPVSGPLQTTLLSGLDDDFGGAQEAAGPGPELQANFSCGNGSEGYDSPATNLCFGHTFKDLPMGILGGTVEIRLRAENGSLNDAVALQALPGAWGWWRRIGTQGETLGVLPGAWNTGMVETLVLDLSALPNADGTTTDLVPLLNADGRLDVFAQDDSSVDYVRVTLVYADPSQAGMTYSEVQEQQAAELVERMSGRELAIADTIEALSQYAEFQGATITPADVQAFQAEVQANGLPGTELAIAAELGMTAAEIASVTALEQSIFIGGTADVAGVDAMEKLVTSLRNGTLGVMASLPNDFPLALPNDPIQCLGATITGGPGVQASCGAGVVGIEILTGSGQIVIHHGNGSESPGWPSKAAVQFGGLDGSALPVGASLQASTVYHNGFDSYPVATSVTKVAGNTFDITSDLSAMGVATKTIQIFDQGVLQVSVPGIPVFTKDATTSQLPHAVTASSTKAWTGVAGPPDCSDYRWEYANTLPIQVAGGATFFGDEVVVVPELAVPAAQWYFGDLVLDVNQVTSFTLEMIDFGTTATVCQPSLGYASDPTARITVCGGDLSSGTTSSLQLFGAPPFAPTLLFVGLQENPIPIGILGGASLVPYPYLFYTALMADGTGGHTLPITGGLGPLKLVVQEVILGPNTVTNAVEIEFLP